MTEYLDLYRFEMARAQGEMNNLIEILEAINPKKKSVQKALESIKKAQKDLHLLIEELRKNDVQ